MAQFYSPQRRKQQALKLEKTLKAQQVSALNHQGQGVVRDGKRVMFVDGALPGDVIDVQPQGKWQGKLMQLRQAAPNRVTPPCEYYDQCGGCDLQHLKLEAQRQHKQQTLVELLQKFADVAAAHWQPAVTGAPWHYRRRTRLACYFDSKRQQLTVGFRARASKRIVAIDNCMVLRPVLNQLLPKLTPLLEQAKLGALLGHIELIEPAPDSQPIVLLRLNQQPSAEQKQALQSFASQEQARIWLQCADERAQPLQTGDTASYAVNDLQLAFQPGDFLQAHAELSDEMVNRVIHLLAPTADDQILDLFAGSGHFSLPLAQRARHVVAVEGLPSMVERLQQSAAALKLPVSAHCADLNAAWPKQLRQLAITKAVLDPARAGAAHAVSELIQLQPQVIVYVSCAPDTFARDAKLLHEAGYRLQQAQLIDMFPQTHHIESLYQFQLEA